MHEKESGTVWLSLLIPFQILNFTCSKCSSSISHAKPILLRTYLLLLIITWIFQSPRCQTVSPFPFPTFNYLPSCLGLFCLTHLFFLSSCKVRTLILVSGYFLPRLSEPATKYMGDDKIFPWSDLITSLHYSNPFRDSS